MPRKIMWTEPRVYVGKDFVIPKAGAGVGGGTLVWLGVMPRFHPADFRTHSTEGVGADWPIGYDDLRPHYAAIEREFGVAGECGPFPPEPYELPMPPHRMNWHAQVSRPRRAQARGAAVCAAGRDQLRAYDGRPACCYCGWCGSGCPTGAKATAVEHLPGAGRARRRARHQRGVRASRQLRRRARPRDGRRLPRRQTARASRERAASSSSPHTPSKRRGCFCSRPTRHVPQWPGQLQRARRPELHEPSDVAGLRHVRRAGQRLSRACKWAT